VYLDEIHIRRLKLLKDFRLSFTNADGTPRMWTVLIGENGTAKTSILQAIALCAAGPAQVNGLVKPIVGHLRDRRNGTASLEIAATFRFSKQHEGRADLHPTLRRAINTDTERLVSELTMKAKGRSLYGRSYYAKRDGTEIELPGSKSRGMNNPLDHARSENLHRWFVSGYGVGRFLPDPTRIPPLDQPGIERLEPLFRSTTGLTSLRFLDHFVDEKARRFTDTLRNALTGSKELVPALEGIELRGAGAGPGMSLTEAKSMRRGCSHSGSVDPDLAPPLVDPSLERLESRPCLGQILERLAGQRLGALPILAEFPQ